MSRLAPALVAALICLAAAPPADAGSYTVRQCDWATGNGHHDFVWQAAGNPTVDPHAGSGCGEFGLAVRNGGGGTQRTYPSGAYGGWFAYAPNGTVFTAFSGAFGALEGCCVNGMTGYAEATQAQDGQGGRAYLFQGHLGNASWYAPSGLQGPVGRGWSASTSGFDARRVGFHLRCGPGFSCSQGIHADLRVRGRSFDFTLRDDAVPVVGDPLGSLLSGGWVRGVQTLSFPAYDAGGGLTGVEAAIGGGPVLRSPAGCTTVAGRYARLQPCPSAHAGEWAFDTTRVPDGGQHVALRATDAGGTTTSRAFAAYVDNTPPAAPRDLAPTGGDGWRAAEGFELTWTNPGGQHAPIARAHWRACPLAGGGGCLTGARTAAGVASSAVAVSAPGEWNVRVWLEDAVGNVDAENVSAPRRLRFDPEPPLLGFLPADPNDPARIAVEVSDLSGVAAGTIEQRRDGAGDWVALATDHSDGLLTASLGDAAPGTYALRARAVDAAGNVGAADGTAWTIPERVAIPLLPSLTSPLAEPRPGGRPRPARAAVTMAVRAPTAKPGGVRRRGARRWGRSVRRLAIAGGRPVLFHGRVGRPLPRHGKLVEVQAHFRGRWRTIATVRSRRDGRWRFRYRFRTAGTRATYRLRSRAPVEGGYPFAAGTSRPVRVTVRAVRR